MVAMLSVGCASSGHARVDTDDNAMGVSGSAEVGTDADVDMDNDEARLDLERQSYDSADGADNGTVSALSFAPETRPTEINKFGADWATRLQVIEVYTFTVPADGSAEFRADTARGSAFVEAAGGAAPGYKVIRHSPNPR